jgi:hypothetical protein
MSPSAERRYQDRHRATHNVELLVARNTSARQRIDRQLAAYPGLLDADADDLDLARAESMFELAASRRRDLTDEVTKMEYGIVRHVNRVQVIVLRYVKALLLIVVTSLAAFASAAALSSGTAATAADERWVAGTLLLWAPAAMMVVAAPVRWLERLLHDEGAVHTTLGADHELRRVERVTNRIAGLVWVLASVAMISLLVDHNVTDPGRSASIGVLLISAALVVRELVLRRLVAHRARDHRRLAVGMR